jgi:hypothetical protein
VLGCVGVHAGNQEGGGTQAVREMSKEKEGEKA